MGTALNELEEKYIQLLNLRMTAALEQNKELQKQLEAVLLLNSELATRTNDLHGRNVRLVEENKLLREENERLDEHVKGMAGGTLRSTLRLARRDG